MTRVFTSPADLVDALVEHVGRDIVLGIPIGIGKAIHVADELFERARNDSSLSLTVFTGLTLDPPRGRNELERRFLGPLAERLYGEWPTPAYASAVRQQSLPPNIRIREFYLRPGAYLANPLVQQSYASINYTQVVAELLELGVNVIAQLVSARSASPGRYSLSSNPEVTLDLLPRLEQRHRDGTAVAFIGQVNRQLPYMGGDAELPADRFDFLLDNEALDFPLFTLPGRPVSHADYATAMHVASLIPDCGTLQIGIGSLSDAVAHCLRLRHESPEVFRKVLGLLPGGTGSKRRQALPAEQDPFEVGLFASTELLSDALFSLFECGLLGRPADGQDPSLVHAGFFLGTAGFYERLRALEESRRRKIRMTRISEVNSLLGDEARKRRQRRKARFVNETMMATLLGAAVSDALEDGRVVSGVGGQFDFVLMAHQLEGGQSILMLRASRMKQGSPQSNIRWSYAHATVPRHYRDVYVTEYGIAATRGRTDRQVIEAMLGLADAEFQSGLLAEAKRARKIPREFELDEELAANTPAALEAIFARKDLEGHFPPYPLGTDFTAIERKLLAALEWLKSETGRSRGKARLVLAALGRDGRGRHAEALARMGLQRPSGIKERLLRRFLELALEHAGGASRANPR